MKPFHLLLAAALTLGLSSCSSSAKKSPPPPTAAKVDIDRYAGKWHEIARLPMPFQKEGDAAYAVYGRNADGTVSVHNVAIRPDGSQRSIDGYATILNPGQNTKLAVRFSTWFGPLIPVPKEGNYWILHIDDGYRHALVGTPDRSFLWILARSPVLPEATYNALVEKAAVLGYQTGHLIRSPRR